MRYSVLLPLACALNLALGLGVVWVSIERTDLAYKLRVLQGRQRELVVLVDKLKTERNNLLAPHNVRRMAAQMGLRPAQPGQVRRLSSEQTGGAP